MILQPASRYPADPRAIMILIFSILTGGAALLLDAKPGTIQEALPTWGSWVWGLSLVAGSAVTLLGTLSHSVTGVVAEQIGSMAVAMSTIFYAIVLVAYGGASSFWAAGIVLAWGVACLLRWVQLQMLIDAAYRGKVRRDISAGVTRDGKTADQ